MGDRKSYAHIDVIKTATSLANRCNHNLDEGERYRKDHISNEKTNFNRMLVGSWDDDYYRLAVERFTSQKFSNNEEWLKYKKEHPNIGDMTYADGGKVRKNAVIAAEIELPYPGDMYTDKDGERYPADNDRYEKWITDTMDYLKQKFGEDNVLNAVLHVDESTPHIHAIVSPTVEKEKGLRLDYHNYIDGKKGLNQFHTEYAKAIGFERGVEKMYVKYDDIKKSRAMLVSSLKEELPEPKPGQTIKEYKEEADEIYKTACTKLKDAEQTAKKLHRASDVAAKAQEENRRLQEENQKLITQNMLLTKQLQKERRDKEIEKMGLELITDLEIRNTYLAIKSSIENLAHQKLQSLGLNYVDKDNDEIDDRSEAFVDADGDGKDDREE